MGTARLFHIWLPCWQMSASNFFRGVEEDRETKEQNPKGTSFFFLRFLFFPFSGIFLLFFLYSFGGMRWCRVREPIPGFLSSSFFSSSSFLPSFSGESGDKRIKGKRFFFFFFVVDSSFCQPPISATFFRTSTLLAIASGTSGFCFAKSVGRTVV